MGYNISGMKVRENTLTILRRDLLQTRRGMSYIDEREVSGIIAWELTLSGDGCSMRGRLSAEQSGIVCRITTIHLGGEGSASVWDNYFLPIMKKTKGNLLAYVVWEGGDTIVKMTVKDGEVKLEEL